MSDSRFASDTAAGICPEAWEALAAANVGAASGYGSDAWTTEARRRFDEVFETKCHTYFVATGTAANSLGIAAANRSYHCIYCHEAAHIDTDECAAPEFFTGGGKVIALPGARGRLSVDALKKALTRGRGFHSSKPGLLSVTQATEWGTLYQAAEIAELSAVAHAAGLSVQMDGARFANAMAALGKSAGGPGLRPADLTWRAGVDLLAFGGTKNGLLNSDAIVFFRPELALDFEHRLKQAGHLPAKSRFASAQWAAILREGAWLRHAANANRRARELAAGLEALPGVRLQESVESNGVFLELPPALAERLQARWGFYRFFGPNGYRLMCSWATTAEDVAAFLGTGREAGAP